MADSAAAAAPAAGAAPAAPAGGITQVGFGRPTYQPMGGNYGINVANL